MGVRINGVWHEELADPGTGGSDSGNGRNYNSPSDYQQAVGNTQMSSDVNTNIGGSQNSSSGSGQGIGSLLNAIASGNLAAAQEAIRQFNLTFGLDKDKFAESVRQYNQNYGLAAAGLTGTLDGQKTLAGQAQDLAAQNQAAQIAMEQAGLTGVFNGQETVAARTQRQAAEQEALRTMATAQNDPFRQMEVRYGAQAGGLLNGMGGTGGANALPQFGAMNGSAQGTGVLGDAQRSMQAISNGAYVPNNGAAPANGQDQFNNAARPNTPAMTSGPAQAGSTPGTMYASSTADPTGSNGSAPGASNRGLDVRGSDNFSAMDNPTYGTGTLQSGQSSQSVPNTPAMQPQAAQAGGQSTSSGILGQFRGPTDVIARNYITADKGTQDMITSAISKNTGLDQGSVDAQIKSQLPKQSGPTFGMASI